jgi:hypothetical protein
MLLFNYNIQSNLTIILKTLSEEQRREGTYTEAGSFEGSISRNKNKIKSGGVPGGKSIEMGAAAVVAHRTATARFSRHPPYTQSSAAARLGLTPEEIQEVLGGPGGVDERGRRTGRKSRRTHHGRGDPPAAAGTR